MRQPGCALDILNTIKYISVTKHTRRKCCHLSLTLFHVSPLLSPWAPPDWASSHRRRDLRGRQEREDLFRALRRLPFWPEASPVPPEQRPSTRPWWTACLKRSKIIPFFQVGKLNYRGEIQWRAKSTLVDFEICPNMKNLRRLLHNLWQGAQICTGRVDLRPIEFRPRRATRLHQV